jgi:hypothetical protein
MVLGGSLCSHENGKYSGPLFARKKKNYFGKFLFFLVLVGAGVSFWDRGRKTVIAFASSFFKSDAKKHPRGLASESVAQPLIEAQPVKPEEQKIEK